RRSGRRRRSRDSAGRGRGRCVHPSRGTRGLRRRRGGKGRACTPAGGRWLMAATDAARRVARPRVRVRYAETDQMGVAYYANYLVWFEVGRTEWLRETGWTYRDMEADGLSLPVIEARCEYRIGAR